MRGKIPNRTDDSTNFSYTAKVTKYCSIVQNVLTLVRFGSKVLHYSTKVLCHMDLGSYGSFLWAKKLLPLRFLAAAAGGPVLSS